MQLWITARPHRLRVHISARAHCRAHRPRPSEPQPCAPPATSWNTLTAGCLPPDSRCTPLRQGTWWHGLAAAGSAHDTQFGILTCHAAVASKKKLALFEAFFHVRSGKGVSQHHLYSFQDLLSMMPCAAPPRARISGPPHPPLTASTKVINSGMGGGGGGGGGGGHAG